MKIDFKVNSHWNCEACSINGIPEENEKCQYCEYTGLEIKKWIKEREMINFLIDEYNNGNILVKP
ncbi:hypothetical protein M5X17_31235 [Paenibacillus alvei]|uniref:hypothetical protein n=1 Tax=Paenibacillus alvei TaxID=44250 RepID=UPI00227E4B2B|nr:hypothetical protein [Paenibacillus alvei]MCY9738168.1 hypothetical protein [Paenibacillus alvei]